MISKGKVCFYPRFGAADMGGVAVHVRTLARGLQARGWQIVPEPDEDTIVHGHAITREARLSVYTSHGIYPITARMPRWQIEANDILFNSLKLAGEVIAVSKWTAAQWSDLVARKPHIIYNAIDLNEWQGIKHGAARANLKIDSHTPVAVWGKTGITDVLDPTPVIELALRYPAWRFVTPLKQEMLRSAPKNLLCIGPQSFISMQQLLQDCDVYLATVQENHSIQVLEAMALGKPVLGYDWGGTAETVTRGGVLVKPRDLAALVKALPEVYDRREELGAEAKQHVTENFTLDKQVDQVQEVYKVVQGRSKVHTGHPKPVRCSIIIPVYNKAPWVKDTILSAMRQVYGTPKYEVIVVNDGSTDNSDESIKKAMAEFSDPGQSQRSIRYYARENSGVSATRNYGISIAKGEYITCLDADDLIDPHFVERLCAALDADPGLGIAYSDFITFGLDQRGIPWESYITCSEYSFDQLKRGNIMPCCNMFRKVAWERAGGYKPINPSWEDYELWLNMGKLGWYGRRVPGSLFKYRKVINVGRDNESHGQEWRLRGTVNKYHRDLYPPMISVVIPCYKHSQFLKDAIESVREQTMPDWEIVVVDDGNDDEEAARIRAIVDGYADQDIRCLRLVQNGGLASARNAGIEVALGQWIVSLDADDKIDPRFLEMALKATNLEPKKFAYTDAYLWWPDNEPKLQLKKLEAHDYDFDELLMRITWSCTIMFSKTAWQESGGYKPQMSDVGGWEDWEYAIQLGRDGVCGVRVPEPLFYYRQHSSEQMRVKAEANKPLLQETLRRLHDDLYRGERPMPCCGAGRRNRMQAQAQEQTAPAAAPAAAPAMRAVPVGGPSNDVLIRYVGVREGTQTWRTNSGHSYRFQKGIAQKVTKQDADFFLALPDFQAVSA